MPRNPAAYIPYRCYADSSGNLVVAVMNETTVPIKNVQIGVSYTDNAGVQRQLKKILPWRLEPSQVRSVATDLGPYSGATCPVTVLAAELID